MAAGSDAEDTAPEEVILTRHHCKRCGHVWYGKPAPKRCARRACSSKYWFYLAGMGPARGRRPLIHIRVVAREERILRGVEAWEKSKLREKKRQRERQVLRKLLKKYS